MWYWFQNCNLRWYRSVSPYGITGSQCVKRVHLTLCYGCDITKALQWRHYGRDSVSNHQAHDCLLNCLFRRRWKKTLRVTGLCVGNSPVTGEFPAQMASNAENVSIWWRHHECHQWCLVGIWASGTISAVVYSASSDEKQGKTLLPINAFKNILCVNNEMFSELVFKCRQCKARISFITVMTSKYKANLSGFFLCMRPANGRRRYVT